MSFLNPYLLLGVGLVAIPILLHMLMKARPKKLVFPALQLIASRRRTNSRRMRLRHIWLLLLRCLVLAMLAVALSRPSLPPANYGLSGREWATMIVIAAGLVGGYWFIQWRWQRNRLPQHVFMYRRACLRGGVGVAALILLGLLVAWPWQRRIAAELAEPRPTTAENLPVSAVFLFDTSPSMDYVFENETRLDAARRLATAHLSRLPAQSRVAVLDTAESADAPLQADMSAVQNRIDGLSVVPVSSPLASTLENAIRLLSDDRMAQPGNEGDQDPYLREIYLFTDLTRGSWSIARDKRLAAKIEAAAWLNLYLIDVAALTPSNVGLQSLKLSSESVASTAELQLDAFVASAGEHNPVQSISVFLPDATGVLVKRDEKLVEFTEGGDGIAVGRFFLRGLPPGLIQGEVRLSTEDALAIDNRSYFTLHVKPPPRVLLTGERKADSELWQNALAPEELVRLERAPYDCRFLPLSSLRTTRLNDIDVVVLMNAEAPDAELWKRLREYVETGGGLFVVMGSDELDMRSYLVPEARELLPVEPLGAIRFREPQFLDLEGSAAHPVFAPFDELGGYGELTAVEIRRCWSVEPKDTARTIARFSDSRRLPALIEQPVGQGRVVVLTTAVDGGEWSDLVRSRWSFIVFADQLTQYLARQSESRHNFDAGEPIVVRVPAADAARTYRIRRPLLEQSRGELAAGDTVISVPQTNTPGQYRLVSASSPELEGAFSVNLPDNECILEQLSIEELDTLLGENQYHVARQIEELDRAVREARLGQEVFPFLVTLALLLFVTEMLVANHFYDSDPEADAVAT